jgi:hypothetical protein
VASPNPKGDENKDRATIEQNPSAADEQVGAHETASPSHVECAETKIDATQNEHRTKKYAHWNRQTFWQKWVTIFTGLAFAAAAYYACQAKIQSGVLTDTFHFANRAYIGVAIPDDSSDWTNGNVFIQIINTGHLPASDIAITVYSARESYPFKTSSGACRVSLHNKIGISPSVAMRLLIPLPNWQVGEYDSIKGQKEAVFAGMEISYYDGFSTSDPVQWCSQTKAINQKVGWTFCPDGELDWLKAATAKQPACQ